MAASIQKSKTAAKKLTAEYLRHRESAAKRAREVYKAGREIGKIPAIKNRRRRAEGKKSFQRFCKLYLADAFPLPFSKDHELVCAKLEEVVRHGGQSAIAMPRGSGKTTLCKAAILWAVLYGFHKFAVIVSATGPQADEILESLRTTLETNEAIAEDFPEAVYPIRFLEGSTKRHPLYRGQPVNIELSSDQIILPRIPKSASSEATIKSVGLTGSIRGMQRTLSSGTVVRPSITLIDDPQTDESARSPGQNDMRERVINNAIQGLAGPGKRMAMLCPCTVIAPDDLADRLLDRKRNPQWQGIRTRMVLRWPGDDGLKHWEEYIDRLSEGLRQERGNGEAVEYYLANREVMDAGFDVAWPERKGENDVSAQQHVMELKFTYGDLGFQAEFQNDPIRPKQTTFSDITDDFIAAKCNGLDRGQVPSSCTQITAFVDVSGSMLWYMVCAWEPFFTGHVIDYGAFPDQARSYFTLADARRTLQDLYAGRGAEGCVYAGLEALINELCVREWKRFDSIGLRVSRLLVDANWGPMTDTVYRFCKQTKHGGIVIPSHGRGISAKARPMDTWQKRPGEEPGLNWVLGSIREGRSVRHVTMDVNYWKTAVMNRLHTSMGDKGSLSLFGSKPEQHRMLKDHLLAETATETSGQGRTLTEWTERPGMDNHWFDCLVGCAVAANMQGIDLTGTRQQEQRKGFTMPARIGR